MKFWMADSSCPDRYMIDMTQCDICHRWLPEDNIQLHILYHKQQQNQDQDEDNFVTTWNNNINNNNNSNENLPNFIMETIPCEECMVLVPINNWDIHRAHVCSGRRQRVQNQQPDNNNNNNNNGTDMTDYYENSSISQHLIMTMETIQCEECGVLVPFHNIELHLARACSALHNITTAATVEPTTNNDKSQHENVLESNGNDITNTTTPTTHRNKNDSKNDINNLSKEKWGCPRCTYMNHDREDSNEEWKCAMCGYSLASAMDNDEQVGQDDTTTKQAPPNTTAATTMTPQKLGGQSWRSVVTSWIPKEYHPLLPDSFQKEKKKYQRHPKKYRQRPRKQQQQSASGSERENHKATPPCLLAPAQSEIRSKRSYHLDWLEREQQQYVQLLQTTKQERHILEQQQQQVGQQDQQHKEMIAEEFLEDMHVSRTDDDELIQQQQQHQDSISDDTKETSSNRQHDHDLFFLQQQRQEDQPQQPQDEQQATSTATRQEEYELLLATEQLCLYHIEYLRRTRIIQELTLDIDLSGLSRWKSHLHHLLHLYQNASELYVDNIIWEIRMCFIQYATLEVMALLELTIWKQQIHQLLGATEGGGVMNHNNFDIERRRACRNDHDISIICQTVLPFLGRPQTRALRAM